MRLILTAVIFVLGLLFVVQGFNFMILPAGAAPGFGLAPNGAAGLAVLRADFPAFFLVGGGALIWGAWKRNGDILLIPALLFGIAFFGRCVSIFADGVYEGFWFPMAVEASTVILSLIGSRVLPHRVT